MTYWLSEPIEALVGNHAPGSELDTCDVLVIGSGYGGAMATMRLAGATTGHPKRTVKVIMLERGKEYALGDFAESLGELPGHVRFKATGGERPTGYAHGLFDFRIGDPVTIVVGNGLGGGSLINANVALEPEEEVFDDNAWPAALRNNKAALAGDFAEARRLLGVAPANVKDSKKFAALERIAQALGGKCKPAPIAVTQSDGPNELGVMQKACIECSNCVTGCNYGAKNTLAMNVLPLARDRGAQIYTGATVLRIEPAGAASDGSTGWNVHLQRTASTKGPLASEVFQLRAQTVIVAAGTLGSSEILLRSVKAGKLRLSDRLGERFSINGDAIAAGYAQETEVNSVAHADFASDPGPVDQRHIGPTITGYAILDANRRDGAGPDYRVVLEDASVPSALALVFGEVVATAALPKRLVSPGLSGPLRPAWFRLNGNSAKDPLAVHPGAIRHSQLLLAMGNDGTPGSLCLRDSVDGLGGDDAAGVDIVWTPEPRDRCSHSAKGWEDRAPQSVFAAIDSLLLKAEGEGAFDGGDYLANPMWRLLPDLRQLSDAALPGHKLIAVHPLGGCPMGDDRTTGVVDDLGRVFNADAVASDGVYAGLYVLDGAIVPRAVATNPFLTISALSLRSAGRMLHDNGWTESPRKVVSQASFKQPPVSRTQVPLDAHRVSARYSEQLIGSLESVPRWLRKALEVKPSTRETLVDLLDEERGLVARIEFDFADMHNCLRDTRKPLPAYCRLYANEAFTDTVPAEHLEGNLLAEGRGIVEIMAWDQPNGGEEFTRALLALVALASRRGARDVGDEFENIAAFARLGVGGPENEALARIGANAALLETFVQMVASLKPGDPTLAKRLAREIEKMQRGEDSDSSLPQALLGPLFCIARHHAQWRELRYSFDIKGANGGFSLTGTKELAYTLSWENDRPRENPWMALIELPIKLKNDKGFGSVRGKLCVDLIDLTKRAPLQVTASPDTPISLGAMASLGMLSLRALFQTHLFSFRTPKYPDNPEDDTSVDLHLRLYDGRIVMPSELIPISVPRSKLDPTPGDIYVRLMHFQPQAPKRGSILLVHGFAHGSSLFTTDTIAVSFASHLYENGYDVWVLDHRLSNALPDMRPGSPTQWLAELQTSIDEIAEHDIARTVDYLYRRSGAPIQVFAHCVGAAAVSMSVLKGYCHDERYGEPGKAHGRSKISALGLHAVPPWLVASMPNRLRANLAAVLKDAIRVKTIDPIPSKTPSGLEKLIDSLCSTIPWPSPADAHRHNSDTDLADLGREVCARYNVIYGIEWNHENLAAQTHRKLRKLVGVGNIETFRQIFFMTLRQRITRRDGKNDYLLDPNIKAYWTFPTLFCHGTDNGVFNPLSSVRSFIRMSLAKNDPADKAPKVPDDIFLFEAPDVGHLDFLFGKHAYRKIFPYLDGFFRVAAQAPNDVEPSVLAELERQRKTLPFDRDPHWRAPSLPECGPTIGWARRDDHHVNLRVWMEALDDTTSPARGVEIGGRNPPRADSIELPKGIEYPGTYFINDIHVPANAPELKLAIDYAGGIWRRGDSVKPRRPSSDSRHESIIQLAGRSWFDRLSGSSQLRKGVAFLLGSCRYTGSPFEREMTDRVFEAMLAHVEGRGPATRPGVDHLLLVGDQIYADATADLFDTREPRERYSGRFREMLQSKFVQRLLASVPCAMAIDDHEIEDNWPGLDQRVPAPPRIDAAFAALKAYVWGPSSRAGNSDGNGAWYLFESGGMPFFVLDTRSQRRLRRAGQFDSATLFDPPQLEALKQWLSTNAHRKLPLFIAAGSPIAPLRHDELHAQRSLARDAEGWIGYPTTLAAVMRHIVDAQIENVVFLSGDPHFSATSRIEVSAGGRPVIAYQIVSSAFYAPLPFANSRECDYVWNAPSQLDLGTVSLSVTSTLLTCAPQQFMRVDVTAAKNAWTIALQVYDGRGAQIAGKVLF